MLDSQEVSTVRNFFNCIEPPLFQVISRIFFSINRSWNGKISLPEFRKSNFLQVNCEFSFLPGSS